MSSNYKQRLSDQNILHCERREEEGTIRRGRTHIAFEGEKKARETVKLKLELRGGQTQNCKEKSRLGRGQEAGRLLGSLKGSHESHEEEPGSYGFSLSS